MKKTVFLAAATFALLLAGAMPAAAQLYANEGAGQSGAAAGAAAAPASPSYILAPQASGQQGGAAPQGIFLSGESAMPLNLTGNYAENYRNTMRQQENERRRTQFSADLNKANAGKANPLGPLPKIGSPFPEGYNATPEQIAAAEEQKNGGAGGNGAGANGQQGQRRAPVNYVYRPIYAPTTNVPSLGTYNQR